MRKAAPAFLFSTLFLVIATPAISKCDYREAQYVLMGSSNVTARFVPHRKVPDIRGDVFFRIHFKQQNWDFWYTFDAGSGYSTVRLVSMDDPNKYDWKPPEPDSGPHRPYPDENFFGIDSNLAVRNEIPLAKSPAPTYIFLPDFGMHVWYNPRTIKGSDRISIPRAFFKLDRCAP